MARKHSRLKWRKIKRLSSILLLLAMFLGTGLLPPTYASITTKASTVESLPHAQTLVEQGRNFYETERFAQAVLIWQQAVAAFKASGNELEQAMTLGNLSLAYQQLGQWTQAESAIASSFKLLGYPVPRGNREVPIQNLEILAQVLDIQGRLQLAIAKAEAALNTWQQAADIYARLGDRNALIRNSINQAQALQTLGLYRQAQKTLNESTGVLQKQPDSLLKVTGLRSLGNVLRVTGNLELSRQTLQQSLKIATSLSEPQAIADVLLSLGNTAQAAQDPQAAIDFYQQAASIGTSPITRINARINQLRLLLETKQLESVKTLLPQIHTQISDLPLSRTAIYARINLAESLIQFRQETTTNSWLDIAHILSTAVQQAKDLQDQRTQSYALGVLGHLYEQTQQWTDAQSLTQQALFIAQTIDAKDIAYRWEWQLGRLWKTQGDLPQAIAAYTEATHNLKSLRSDLVAISPDVQFNFRDRVEPVYRELVDLLLQSPGNTSPSLENLQTARTTIESLQLAELENFFRSACLDATPALLDLVVDKNDQTAAVLYPVILPDRLEVILKLPTQPNLRRHTTKISQSQVENTLNLLQQYLKEPDRTNDVQQLSQQVYSWLIRPLETELARMQVTKLVFVLDGALRNIPMAVLYDTQQQKYLIEKYAIALTPSLQLLEPKTLQRQRLRALVGGLSEPHQVAGIEFPQLQNVQLELKQIESEVPRSESLYNQEFTKINIQNQIASTPYTVVHMATHGQFSSNLDETFILAWDQLLKIDDLDNLLRTSDANGSNAIELLVLSACETAAGDNRATLGLAGIAVRAGARSTLATLWQVDDQSTAELMSEFYRQLTNTNLTKAEALQRAQLALWNNQSQDWKRPYFWASYVLVGNWL